MAFDVSRFTFDAWNDYFGVVMEQGRVQTDADWNEWLAEFARRVDAGTLDLLGGRPFRRPPRTRSASRSPRAAARSRSVADACMSTGSWSKITPPTRRRLRHDGRRLGSRRSRSCRARLSRRRPRAGRSTSRSSAIFPGLRSPASRTDSISPIWTSGAVRSSTCRTMGSSTRRSASTPAGVCRRCGRSS